jgi:hypothetical protein
VLVAHDVQLTPMMPQAIWAVPGEHVPPLQHPPRHGSLEEHVAPHVLLVVSQASSVAQSVFEAQPQVPLARHAVPEALPVHETQAPLAPQAV